MIRHFQPIKEDERVRPSIYRTPALLHCHSWFRDLPLLSIRETHINFSAIVLLIMAAKVERRVVRGRKIRGQAPRWINTLLIDALLQECSDIDSYKMLIFIPVWMSSSKIVLLKRTRYNIVYSWDAKHLTLSRTFHVNQTVQSFTHCDVNHVTW